MTEEEMNEKVKSIAELHTEARVHVGTLKDMMHAYDYSRSDKATDEERFNEGKHGRNILQAIDDAQASLTQLRMRIALQLEGRDNSRARQLDRLLDLVREVDDDDDGGRDVEERS